MINEDKYLLQLTDSDKRILESWQKLRNDGQFCDVTLVSSDGVKIKAHKIILASLSTVFETMLRNEDQQQALLYLRGVNYSQIVNLLDFIYNGQVSITFDQLDTFLQLANDLKIKGLDEEVKVNDVSKDDNQALTKKQKRNESIINEGDVTKVPKLSLIENTSSLNDNKSTLNFENIKKNESILDAAHKPVHTNFTTDRDNSYGKFVTDEKKSLMTPSAPGQCEKIIDIYKDYYPEAKVEVEQDQQSIKSEIDPHDSKKVNHCDRCSFQTNFKCNLSVHIKSIHEGVRYPCETCEYRATTQSALKHHVRAIHEGIKYGCQECNFQTGHRHYLVQHTARMHDQSIPEDNIEAAHKPVPTTSSSYKDNAEKMVIDTKEVIKNEIDPYATKIKAENTSLSHSCDRCSYQTSIKSHLNVHIKSIHEGVRYPCAKCTYRATTQSGLNHHVKSIHEGVKYNCTECDLQTSQKHYLTQHMNRVHDTTLYSCSECEDTLTGKYKFDQHMKSRHNSDASTYIISNL